MIPARELLLLMNSADSPANLDAITDLIHSGLSAFVIKDGAIAGMQNTREGNERLSAILLPPTDE
jgi:hypothetical protein